MTFNLNAILIGIFFSIVGYAAWHYGRVKQDGKQMLLGVALMVYGYFIPNPWWAFAVGALLTGLLFWP